MIEPGALAMITAEPTGGVVWHASRGAITLRVACEGAAGARRASASRCQRVRADGADRRAALRPRARAACARTDYPLDSERRAARCSSSAAHRERRELQRRPRCGVVLGRPPLQPRGRPRRGGRAADRRRSTRRPRAIDAQVSVDILQQQPSASTDAGHPAAARLRAASSSSRARRRASSCARVCSKRAGTPSSASQPLRTAPGASTSPTAPTSTSTRPRCAAALRSTRCSPAKPAANRPTRQSPGTRRRVTPPHYPFSKAKEVPRFGGLEGP